MRTFYSLVLLLFSIYLAAYFVYIYIYTFICTDYTYVAICCYICMKNNNNIHSRNPCTYERIAASLHAFHLCVLLLIRKLG